MKLAPIVFSTLLGLFVIGMSAPAFGQEGSGQMMNGFLKDFIDQVDFVQGEILSLEGAMPAEKAGWRPMEGVRSVSEVYLHIAGGNYLMCKLMGTEPPADVNFSMDMKKWDAQTTDMAKISEMLKASFDHVRGMAKKMSAADLDKQIEFFGRMTSMRSAMISALNHMHEHLGQSIAYARMNHVVPPWSAAQQEQEKKTLEKEGK